MDCNSIFFQGFTFYFVAFLLFCYKAYQNKNFADWLTLSIKQAYHTIKHTCDKIINLLSAENTPGMVVCTAKLNNVM